MTSSLVREQTGWTLFAFYLLYSAVLQIGAIHVLSRDRDQAKVHV